MHVIHHLKDRFKVLQDQLRDPLLTALTVLLVLMIFVIAPLHAAGIVKSQGYGIAAALVLIGAVLVISGSVFAVGAMLIAVGLAITANILPRPLNSSVDVKLYAVAWVTLGIALLWVVARAVFAARPRHIPSHRWCDSTLFDHRRGVYRTLRHYRPSGSRVVFQHANF